MEQNKTDNDFTAKIIAQKEILNFNEALIYLGISSSLLYKLTAKKKIKFSKPNKGRLFFKKKNLDDWMLGNPSDDSNELSTEIDNYLKKNSNV